MQQYADIYLLQSHYMFQVSQHPSSGVLINSVFNRIMFCM